MSSSKVEHEESQLADTSEETEKNDPLLKFPGTEFKTDSDSSEIGLAEVRLFNTEKKEMSVSIAGENESELKVLKLTQNDEKIDDDFIGKKPLTSIHIQQPQNNINVYECTARYEKWETLKTSDHPLVKKILDCLFETQSCSSDVSNPSDTILMVYNRCVGGINQLFRGASTDVNIFSDSKITSVIKCFEDLDEEDVQKSFFLMLLLIIVGEFFSAPAITLVDSAVIKLLGEDADRYGHQRMFGSLGWGLSMFLLGIALDRSTAFTNHPCGRPGEREKNYKICFFAFSVLMGGALISATQIAFRYDDDYEEKKREAEKATVDQEEDTDALEQEVARQLNLPTLAHSGSGARKPQVPKIKKENEQKLTQNDEKIDDDFIGKKPLTSIHIQQPQNNINVYEW
ncbi:hypothetical protein V9T40_010249 [Parthenolecanium corni]|uniref:Major facilitator superfamily associated domain-containing protein n=1 Tax=Parthenolecanium corni TaxID=536013 RepID=A0AAN9TLI8_9HEMI